MLVLLAPELALLFGWGDVISLGAFVDVSKALLGVGECLQEALLWPKMKVQGPLESAWGPADPVLPPLHFTCKAGHLGSSWKGIPITSS